MSYGLLNGYQANGYTKVKIHGLATKNFFLLIIIFIIEKESLI
jgi:hypothetical protein